MLTGNLANLKEIYLVLAVDPETASLPLERLAPMTQLLENNVSLVLQTLTEYQAVAKDPALCRRDKQAQNDHLERIHEGVHDFSRNMYGQPHATLGELNRLKEIER